jgi:hypothetical protein
VSRQKRITVNVDAEVLDELADRTGETKTALVRQALRLRLRAQRAWDSNGKVKIQDSPGSETETIEFL